MSIDEQHIALPQLYGAPAYARPVVVLEKAVARPFDPDELPIEADQTDEERAITATIPPGVQSVGLEGPSRGTAISRRMDRSLSVRGIADKILGGS